MNNREVRYDVDQQRSLVRKRLDVPCTQATEGPAGMTLFRAGRELAGARTHLPRAVPHALTRTELVNTSGEHIRVPRPCLRPDGTVSGERRQGRRAAAAYSLSLGWVVEYEYTQAGFY